MVRRRSAPGHLEGNVAFAFLNAFETDVALLQEMKAHYVRGELRDSLVKKRVEELLQEKLRPIRERREEAAKDMAYVRDCLKVGTIRVREAASVTLNNVKQVLGIALF
jgi:tryptophanyl-tRNA synthetase